MVQHSYQDWWGPILIYLVLNDPVITVTPVPCWGPFASVIEAEAFATTNLGDERGRDLRYSFLQDTGESITIGVTKTRTVKERKTV